MDYDTCGNKCGTCTYFNEEKGTCMLDVTYKFQQLFNGKITPAQAKPIHVTADSDCLKVGDVRRK